MRILYLIMFLLIVSAALAQKATPVPTPAPSADAAKVAARAEAAADQWTVKKLRSQTLELQRAAIDAELTSLSLELAALKSIELGHADAEAVIAGTEKDITKPLEIKTKAAPPIKIESKP